MIMFVSVKAKKSPAIRPVNDTIASCMPKIIADLESKSFAITNKILYPEYQYHRQKISYLLLDDCVLWCKIFAVMISEKVLYLIGGPNGSGKTTLAQELTNKHKNLKFMNADNIATERNVSIVDAGRIVLKDMEYALKNGDSFIWETTLSGTYHTKFIKMAHDANYKIIFSYVMLASPEQNIARVQQRVALGGHNVPEEVLRRRYLKSVMNFKPVCEISDSWILYYNGDKRIIEIARGGNTQFSITDAAGYEQCQVTYKNALEEIIRLADKGAKHAQRVANQAGINPVFEKLCLDHHR